MKKLHSNVKSRSYMIVDKNGNNHIANESYHEPQDMYHEFNIESHGVKTSGKGKDADIQDYSFVSSERTSDRLHESQILTKKHNHQTLIIDKKNRLKHRKIDLMKQKEDRKDRESKQLHELVSNGILVLKNGKYVTNEKFLNRALEKKENGEYLTKKEKEITQKAEEISKNIASYFSIGKANTKLIKKLVARHYDRKEMKDLKREYKKSSKIKRWEDRYGKLRKRNKY